MGYLTPSESGISISQRLSLAVQLCLSSSVDLENSLALYRYVEVKLCHSILVYFSLPRKDCVFEASNSCQVRFSLALSLSTDFAMSEKVGSLSV